MAKKNKLNIAVFKRLLSYWRTYKGLFFIAVSCTLLLAIIGPFRPWLIGEVVQKYIVETQNGEELLTWTLVILGILLLEGVLQFVSNYFSNLFAQSIIRDIRQQLMGHILKFRIRYFDKTPVGSLVTRLISDLEAITDVFSSGMMAIVGDLLMLVFVISGMFFVDWQLALLTLVPIPLLIMATRIFARVVRGTQMQESVQVTKLNTFVNERLTGISVVQLFGREKIEADQFDAINKDHRQAHVNAVWAYSIFFPIVELLSSMSIALLLVWGALQVSGRSSSEIESMYGTIFSFILWIYMLYRPIRQMADKFNILQRGTVRAERVFEILDREDAIQDRGTIDDCAFDQTIAMKELYFAYNGDDWVLKDINLDIASGQTVAFVGATGAGKSSIVNLIGRFYEFQKGEIRLGDVDLTEIDLTYLRKNVAIVLQDVFLFSDSILNNITLNDPDISRAQVIEASKAVGVHEFIMSLPGNYDYQVGERGGILSVGQRQLLSFIRAYVYNPKILILDEATSSVDSESEALIQRATEHLTKGRTSIIIAHRLSTIQKADKIVVLEKGELKEQGSHSELLKHNGYYKTLYEMQFSELEK
ncbi:ABC transporter ATP-binding protein/permease [Crocinitomicaceae bacterium]|jgi:ATP-binding cassette subfamily B protein|nr:ABC transporter ATP-binding protein/permease [Crocinitomicaceae bacterium]MDG1035483.1 ABC transporter ATP-binding protein [Crocinitomicaceae bacterium]